MKVMVAFLNSKNKRKDINRKHLEKINKINRNKDKFQNSNNIVNKNSYDRENISTKINKEEILQNVQKLGISFKRNIDNKEKNNFIYRFNFSNIIFDIIICVFFGIIFIYSFTLNKDIFNKCINFRQANKNNIELKNLLSLTSIGNDDNYIFKEVIVKKEDENTKPYDAIAELLDSKVNEISDINVFFNKDSTTVNITEENSTFQRVAVNNSQILNYSSNRNIDYASLLNSDIYLTKASDKILLYNTHTSETYSNSDNYKFDYTGIMRTTDASYNMLEIAKSLNEILNEKGINSVHNTTPHDYGAYTSAYMNSRMTVTNALQEMQGAGITIDVHRDAIEDLTFRPVANIDGVQVCQLMFVVGIGTNSSPNPYYLDNLKLALKIQEAASKIYPGLFRPMIIRNSVYNQDLNKFSLLVEFGATGNTIEEVKLSTRCLANLLNVIYKD